MAAHSGLPKSPAAVAATPAPLAADCGPLESPVDNAATTPVTMPKDLRQASQDVVIMVHEGLSGRPYALVPQYVFLVPGTQHDKDARICRPAHVGPGTVVPDLGCRRIVMPPGAPDFASVFVLDMTYNPLAHPTHAVAPRPLRL